MIPKNLKNVVSSYFQTEKERFEDKVALQGLMAEDRMDEATAYAYLLVNIAAGDGHFDERERNVVHAVLSSTFPDQARDAHSLIRAAEGMLQNFRSSSAFVDRIKQEYSAEERERLYAAIDNIISADGQTDPMEEYLRQKFKAALK